jgi:hypothetical protein
VYILIKVILFNLLKQKIDNIKYEDYLRSLFGNKGFIFFTMDKILGLV